MGVCKYDKISVFMVKIFSEGEREIKRLVYLKIIFEGDNLIVIKVIKGVWEVF